MTTHKEAKQNQANPITAKGHSRAIQSYMDQHRQELYDLLKKMVLIQSGSANKTGVDKMGKLIFHEMSSLGFDCEFEEQSLYGNHLIARSPACKTLKSGEKQILITGHMDTVFPHDTEFNWYKEDENRCYGPGVADMKGGLVVGISAIKALADADLLKNLPICFIFNSDEEIGSPSSRKLIAREAKKSHTAYVLEAGGLAGEIVTGRKGNISVRLELSGQAGHAAFAGRDKASAILELAHKTIAIEALNNPDQGISANVGTIEGGMGPNTVPANARAAIDLRHIHESDAHTLMEKLSAIVQTRTIAGTRTKMEIKSSRPAMPETPENLDLFNSIKVISDKLGLWVIPELRQGVSDANLIAKEGVRVIDGLGPIGAKDHSEDEYIEKTSLYERSVLFGNILASI